MQIVVLDDSQTVLLTIQSLLEEIGASKEEIRLFKNGHEALAYIEHNSTDIIFSDIQMPGISGYEFVEKLLELSRRYVPVLFIVSADENHSQIVKMKQIGARRFIRKPINGQYFRHFVTPEIAKVRARYDKKEHSKIESVSENSADDNTAFNLDFDYDALAERIGINVKYIPRLVQSFISESKAVLVGMEDSIAVYDFARIAQFAHSLKGSAGNMKFDTLYETAKTMEHAALAEDKTFPYKEYHQMMKKGFETSFPAF